MSVAFWMLLFGGIFYLLTALYVLARPKSEGWKGDLYLFSLLVSTAVLIVRTAVEPLLESKPLFYNLSGVVYLAAFLSVPVLVFRYMVHISDGKLKLTLLSRILTVSSALLFVVSIGYALFNLTEYLTRLYWEFLFYRVMNYVCAVPFLLFFGMMIYSLIRINSRLKSNRLFLIFNSLVITVMVGMLLEVIGFKTAAGIILTLILFFFDYMLIHYPNLRQDFKASLLEGRYQKTHLQEEVILKIRMGLDRYMEKERLYLSETLSLAMLSKNIGVSTHQLSEYINFTYGFSFNYYVNKFRVDYAIVLLEEDPDQKIMSVAFDSGFNSVSSFYRSFKEVTGMSPREYLERA